MTKFWIHRVAYSPYRFAV